MEMVGIYLFLPKKNNYMDKTIMRIKTITITAMLLAAFFLVSCKDLANSDYKSFNSKLRGTWESNDKTEYSGELEIGSDWIKITGYPADTSKDASYENQRPFKQFYKGTPLKGYSEDGKFADGKQEGTLFIENGGITETVPYIYSESRLAPEYKLVQKLQFTFGGRLENMDYK